MYLNECKLTILDNVMYEKYYVLLMYYKKNYLEYNNKNVNKNIL